MNHIYFPSQSKTPANLQELLQIFDKHKNLIDSSNDDDESRRNSDAVLNLVDAAACAIQSPALRIDAPVADNPPPYN